MTNLNENEFEYPKGSLNAAAKELSEAFEGLREAFAETLRLAELEAKLLELDKWLSAYPGFVNKPAQYGRFEGTRSWEAIEKNNGKCPSCNGELAFFPRTPAYPVTRVACKECFYSSDKDV